MRTLFLDYDGVLHPNEVFRRPGRGIVLEMKGHRLFEHVELFSDLLEPHRDVQIVLSTSWVSMLDFKRARSHLPKELQARVIGSTFHSSMDLNWWNDLSRFQQIANYVGRHRLSDWIAVDDNDEGWPADKREHLVHCDEHGGIGESDAQARLIDWLAQRPSNDRRMR